MLLRAAIRSATCSSRLSGCACNCMHTCLGCSLHTWSHTAAYGNAPPDRSFLGRLHYRMKFVVHSSAHRLDPGFFENTSGIHPSHALRLFSCRNKLCNLANGRCCGLGPPPVNNACSHIMLFDIKCLSSRICYLRMLQDNGLVPIVEPEMTLGAGDYTIEDTSYWSERVLTHVFRHLNEHDVMLEGILMKPSMCLPGMALPAM